MPSRVMTVPNADGDKVEQVVLEQPVAAGSVLFTVLKTAHSIVPKPAWNTLQVGEGEHANFGQKAVKLNHSSLPNTRIQIGPDRVEVVAAKEVAAGDALSFDYNSNEWEMDEPFTDWKTGESVQGFRHAKPERQQHLLGGYASPHILALAKSHGVMAFTAANSE